MKLISKDNGGVIEVDDELGSRFLQSGSWASVDPAPKPRRRTSKPVDKAPQNEE